MIYLLGNCQADFLGRSLASLGHECTYRVLASPLTYPSHPGRIPASLLEQDRQHGLTDYLYGRELFHQFAPIGDDDASPQLIILSLFHENTPLFVHDKEQYVFYMSPKALTDKPELMQWTQDNCKMFKPNPATYLERYGKMLVRMRKEFPGVPILVLSRLSHCPAFGPDPFSYLEGWGDVWRSSGDILNRWSTALPDVHILDMDRIFGGIWAESDKRIESLCPFLKIKLEETDGQITGLHAQRDIEHIGPMPDRMAQKVEGFLKTGSIEYGEAETTHPEWRRPWRPAALDDSTMLEKLSSGANYLSAEAISGFFLNLGRDYTDLLVQAKDFMPVCHMSLHMIKNYARIHRNPALAVWCDAHMDIARNFTANGPLYQESYMNRLKEMKRLALEQSSPEYPQG